MPQWIKFKLIKRPYYDPRTNRLIGKIDGRRNRPKVDPFVGGGMVYPDLSGLRIISWHEKYRTLCVLIDADETAISELCGRSEKVRFDMTPTKTIYFNFQHFHPTKLTPDEALKVLINECGLPAGTTLNEDLTPNIPIEEEMVK